MISTIFLSIYQSSTERYGEHTCRSKDDGDYAVNSRKVTMWQSAERVKAVVIPLAASALLGCILLLASLSSTRQANRSLASQLKMRRDELKEQKDANKVCEELMEEKDYELRSKEEDIQQLELKNINTAEECSASKSKLEEDNKQLLDMLMGLKKEKQKLETKVDVIEAKLEVQLEKEDQIKQNVPSKENVETNEEAKEVEEDAKGELSLHKKTTGNLQEELEDIEEVESSNNSSYSNEYFYETSLIGEKNLS